MNSDVATGLVSRALSGRRALAQDVPTDCSWSCRGAGRRAAASALIRPLTSTPPNLSWLSIRMEQVAQVSRAKDADDARVVSLALTEPGWKALEGATPLVFDAERELLADFTHDERRLLADLLSGWSHQHPDNKPDRPRP